MFLCTALYSLFYMVHALQSQSEYGYSSSAPCNNTSDFTLQHADSEGTLLGDLCSLQPASSVSTLASSVGEPQTEGPGVEEEEDVEEHSPKRHSPEQLCPSDVDPKLGSAPSEGGLEEKAQHQREEEEEVVVEEEEEGDCYKEDILMGDDQVADFASSMMAAISCWHYRARALLSAPFTTVRLSATHGFFHFPVPFHRLTDGPLTLATTMAAVHVACLPKHSHHAASACVADTSRVGSVHGGVGLC